MPSRSAGLATRCIHAGESRDAHGALHQPLYDHSTFGFASSADLDDVVEGRTEGSFYTRYGQNPTLRSLEAKLAAIEGGQAACVFGSGMAALSATFLSHATPGDHIVCVGDLYGGTFDLLRGPLAGMGISTTFLLVDEVDRLPDAIDRRTRIVFFESPTNPTLEVVDVSAIARVASRTGAVVVVDSTFATPVNQRPLGLGADLVVHSATKYLGGHSDLTGGVVIGSSDRLAPTRAWRRDLGQVMAPQVAALLARSLRTLVVRVRQQNASAATLAERLAEHPRVGRVRYPGLALSPGHAIARQQMDGYGGMLSIELATDLAGATSFVDGLRVFAIAPSLGGVESLVTQPITTSHREMPAADRIRRGITENMVRLSVGLEDVEDLWEDLHQSLARLED